MKAIILAAGKGSRISDDIEAVPKSTLEINGKPIIRSTVEMLLKHDIEVAVCIGYRFQVIKEVLAGLKVTFYYNPFYDLVNNIGTLWFAKEFIDDDCMLISADVIFKEDFLERIISERGDLLMVTDKLRIDDGDYFFVLDDEGKIVEYGPDIEQDKRSCEYVGLSKIGKNAAEAFCNQLDLMINSGENQCYFEYVFFSFINSEKYQLKNIDVSGCLWREIDKIEDYKKALKQFA